jgi:sugar-specific transcriptional regulator TrmB
MKVNTARAAELIQSGLGLNRYQARAYVAVLQGCRTARDIAGRARIPVTRVYDTLERLAEMGLVQRTGQGFVPLEPRAAVKACLQVLRSRFEEEFNERERLLAEFLRVVEGWGVLGEQELDAAVLNGLGPVIAKTYEVCERGSRLFFAVRKAVKLKEEFMRVVEQLVGKEINFILHPSVKLVEEDAVFFKKVGARVFQSPAVLLDILVTDAGEALLGLPLDEEPVAVWVRHRGFAGSLMEALTEVLG